jgi:glycine cleavage system transcriptional repressor
VATALISIICEDRPGVIAAVTGRLYDLEINLGDTSFAVLGIEITGDDSPGLIARLSEAFATFGANIVALNSQSVAGASGAGFLLRLAISVPEDKAPACLATVANTAGQMNLKCQWWKHVW